VSKSNRRPLGRRSGPGTITVIEAQIHRSFARNAKLAFYCTALVVALLSMTVLADQMHPIIAAIVGTLIGVVLGAFAWVLVRIWPVIRLLWWWLPEITLAVIAVYGWTALANHTTAPVRLAVVALVVGVPAAVPPIRRRVKAVAWCLIVRHRLRVCFAQFIIRNQSGTLPLILWACPTPVGERVWIYLRPGLSESDLQSDLEKIAVACHASSALVERASDHRAAYLRIDIKRREVLTAKVGSPLVDLVDPDTPAVARDAVEPPTALDLPDVTAGRAATKPGTDNGSKPATTNGAKPATTTAMPAGGADDDDISQWI
jgi:hypothetical protein